jgi:hypothetical protein
MCDSYTLDFVDFLFIFQQQLLANRGLLCSENKVLCKVSWLLWLLFFFVELRR